MTIPSIVNCTKFYALPKVHKPTVAFCPIGSNIGVASYKLAHSLPQSRSHLTCNKLYTLQNSSYFVNKKKKSQCVQIFLINSDM